jgi:Tol biopolymer transport system component
MSEPAPSPAAVRAALERILAWRQFSQASQQSQILRFVVEETIQGRPADLKEYTIGEALRGPSFDAAVDPTVRVQAGRIRKKLAVYYAGPGAEDSVTIEIPIPGYVPVFRNRRPAQPPVQPVRRRLGFMFSATCALLIAAGTLVRWYGGSAPGRLPLQLFKITRDRGLSSGPAVSRDGRFLAYSSDRAEPGNDDIWILELAGGEPRRLTRHPATDSTPDISPDSRTVVFRSTRDGGGIYTVPAAGGSEKRIADEGFSPRFSPDGRWIAYSAFGPRGENNIYVVSVRGGQPRRIQSQDMPCTFPLWTPDGRSIQFAVMENGAQDWWVAPFDPSVDHPVAAANSGLQAALRRQGLDGIPWVRFRDWLDNDLVLSSPEARSLLHVPMVPGSWTVRAQITQILPLVDATSVRVVKPSSGPPSLFYEQHLDQPHIWGIPLAGDLVESTGELQQLADEMTDLGLDGSRPSLSGDARYLVFSVDSNHSPQAWLHDLKAGTKTLLGSFADRPVISPDGEVVAYRQRSGRQEAIFTTRTAEPGRARQVCADCGEPRSWTPGRKGLLYLRDGALWLLDMGTGSTTPLLQRDGYKVFHASLSPEGRRIALVIRIPGKAKIQGVVAAFDGAVGPEAAWVPIAEETYELSIEWTLKGDALYYFNLRDGSRCLWEQKLDPAGLKPAGEPVGVRHFRHQRRYPTSGSWIAPARGLIGVNLTETLANIYRLYLP